MQVGGPNSRFFSAQLFQRFGNAEAMRKARRASEKRQQVCTSLTETIAWADTYRSLVLQAFGTDVRLFTGMPVSTTETLHKDNKSVKKKGQKPI